MSWPSLRVRIATSAPSDAFTLDDATEGRLANPPTIPGYTLGDAFGKVWTDVTDYVRSDAGVSINRGASRQRGPFFTFEAGTATFTLDDRSGDFDPLNLTGPYVSAGQTQLLPGLLVDIAATYQGTLFPLFVGYVNQWNKAYPGHANTDSVVEVVATDATSILATSFANKVEPATGSGDLVPDRLNRILDAVSWPTDERQIDQSGLEQYAATELGADGWSLLYETAAAVNGYLYLSKDGVVVYQSRSQFPRTADFTVGQTGDIPVVELHAANDWDQVYNVVRIGRQDGPVQQLQDETSKALYGVRTFSQTSSPLLLDTDVANTAGYVLDQFKDQALRLEGVKLEPDGEYTNDQWTILLGLDVMQRVQATITTTDGRAVTLDGLVRGVQVNVSPYQWHFDVSTLAAPQPGGNFTLNDPVAGLLADATAVNPSDPTLALF